ncbi:hypothetical protein BJ912DRAFT_686127 [Pholiota molesta]|nr:hypothetical protein BJ912DRAFT_686127 [Pholiota molesta]
MYTYAPINLLTDGCEGTAVSYRRACEWFVPGVLHFGTHSSRVIAEIRICTMSSGAPHPLASKSSLQFDGENIYEYLVDDTMEPVLQIAHNILAVSLGVSDTRTLIWDWTTSDLLLDTAWLPESFPEYMTAIVKTRGRLNFSLKWRCGSQ